jgi:CRP-like cAMP-binding protein
MSDLLYTNIKNKVSLTETEWETCKSFFISKKIRRRQYLLQEGNVCEYVIFVNKGSLRSYSVDKEGEEHIVQFALEGWWIGDIASFLTGEPASYNIEALEDSEIWMIDKPSQNKLFDLVPGYERYNRLIIESAYVALHKRLLSTISETTEEKYLRMVKTYPDIIQRVPQHMIASYLGVKPETISRIRKKILDHK